MSVQYIYLATPVISDMIIQAHQICAIGFSEKLLLCCLLVHMGRMQSSSMEASSLL